MFISLKVDWLYLNIICISNKFYAKFLYNELVLITFTAVIQSKLNQLLLTRV